MYRYTDACMHAYVHRYIHLCTYTSTYTCIFPKPHLKNPYAQYMYIQYLCGVGLKYVA